MDLLPPLMQAELVQLFLVSVTKISPQFKKQKLIESAVYFICVILLSEKNKNYSSSK